MKHNIFLQIWSCEGNKHTILTQINEERPVQNEFHVSD
jgi:hypothetical protein